MNPWLAGSYLASLDAFFPIFLVSFLLSDYIEQISRMVIKLTLNGVGVLEWDSSVRYNVN